MTQKGYLKKVHQKFNINSNIKFVSTPLTPHFKLKATMSPTSIEEREYITHISLLARPVVYFMQWCVQHLIYHKMSQ